MIYIRLDTKAPTLSSCLGRLIVTAAQEETPQSLCETSSMIFVGDGLLVTRYGITHRFD